jgi:SAM-dependent methyltransferase
MKNIIYHKLQNYYSKNKTLSRQIARHLPICRNDPNIDYEGIVAQIASQIIKPLVLDIGGGKQCFLASRSINGQRMICLDLQLNQLITNYEVDYRIVGDALNIPFADNSVDMVISRSFIEHVSSAEGFIQEANRVLKKGGYLVSLFPCKFAIFALINQILPECLARKALYHFLQPEEQLGFKAYYNKCYFTGIKKLLSNNKFRIVDIRDYHFSSGYFEFFVPLFLISCVYEICTLWFKNLASYLVISAQKQL